MIWQHAIIFYFICVVMVLVYCEVRHVYVSCSRGLKLQEGKSSLNTTTFKGKIRHKTARFFELEVALLVLTSIALGYLKAHVLSRGSLGNLSVDTRSGDLRDRNINDEATSLAVEVAVSGTCNKMYAQK